jgi:hypothetical protein
VLGQELLDAREVQNFFVGDVVILYCPPHWFPAAKAEEVELDQLPYVVRDAGKGLADEAGCFLGAEWLIGYEEQEEPTS